MSRRPAAASDFLWFREQFPWLDVAYCITLTKGSTPAEFLTRIDVDDDVQADRAAFALAERLTGVRLTPDLLSKSTYLCGPVRD